MENLWHFFIYHYCERICEGFTSSYMVLLISCFNLSIKFNVEETHSNRERKSAWERKGEAKRNPNRFKFFVVDALFNKAFTPSTINSSNSFLTLNIDFLIAYQLHHEIVAPPALLVFFLYSMLLRYNEATLLMHVLLYMYFCYRRVARRGVRWAVWIFRKFTESEAIRYFFPIYQFWIMLLTWIIL